MPNDENLNNDETNNTDENLENNQENSGGTVTPTDDPIGDTGNDSNDDSGDNDGEQTDTIDDEPEICIGDPTEHRNRIHVINGGDAFAIRDIALSPEETNIDGSDQVLFLKDGTALRKINYEKLAKAIIEQYNQSELAGQQQSIQDAIDYLNNMATPDPNTFAINFTETGPDEIYPIQTGETLQTLFGKIAYWYTKLGQLAWNPINMVTDMTAQYTPGEHVVDAAAGYTMQGQINSNLNEINILKGKWDYIKIRGNGNVGNAMTQLKITNISIGKGDNSLYFGKGSDASGLYFTIKHKGVFLEVAQTYTDETSALYKTNAKVYINNQDGFIGDNGMGVGVTAYNYGDNDNVSAESITIGNADDPTIPSRYVTVDDNNPVKLVLAASHGKSGTKVSMTVTLVPLYPIGE